MDIYYFYNGIQNIINVALRNDAYLLNYEKIIQDPLIFLDFDKSNTCIKGGATTAGATTDAAAAPTTDAAATPAENNVSKIETLTKEKEKLTNILKEIESKTNSINNLKKSLNNENIEQSILNAIKITQQEGPLEQIKTKEEFEKRITNIDSEIKELEKEGGEEDEEDEEEEESEIEDSDDDDSGGQIMESIQMIIKCIVFICLLTIIPLAPFIAISYYSFKKLKLYYDERMLTL